MPHPVVLVDGDDRPLGTAEKIRAHGEGWLHRAFSVFLFDSRGRLLLQQRAEKKYHSGGLWSNTCCSHPRPDEEAVEGARRRLVEEMGIDTALAPAFHSHYDIDVGADLTEHEYNHVFMGAVDGATVQPDPSEVAAWRWGPVSQVEAEVAQHPEQYTAWFPVLLRTAAALFREWNSPSPMPEGSHPAVPG